MADLGVLYGEIVLLVILAFLLGAFLGMVVVWLRVPKQLEEASTAGDQGYSR